MSPPRRTLRRMPLDLKITDPDELAARRLLAHFGERPIELAKIPGQYISAGINALPRPPDQG